MQLDCKLFGFGIFGQIWLNLKKYKFLPSIFRVLYFHANFGANNII